VGQSNEKTAAAKGRAVPNALAAFVKRPQSGLQIGAGVNLAHPSDGDNVVYFPPVTRRWGILVHTKISSCPFCAEEDGLFRNKFAYVRKDEFPVSQGHALIVPYRHFSNFFDATDDEQAAIFRLMDQTQKRGQIWERSHTSPSKEHTNRSRPS